MNVKVKKGRGWWLVGVEAACVVLAVAMVVVWAVGPRCRPVVAWASEDARRGVQVIGGRVNVHFADARMLKVWPRVEGEEGDAWVGGRFEFGTWPFQPMLGGIPLVGELFQPRPERDRDERGLAWLPRVGSWASGHTVVVVPLVWVALVPGLLAVWLERVRRRRVRAARAGRCTSCAYLLVGLAGGVCPECGKGFEFGC